MRDSRSEVDSTIRALITLLRPANVTTALADVAAGFAIANEGYGRVPGSLLLATACLYAGGVALNDFFDRHVDRLERPERPIPAGQVPARVAAVMGASLLVAGVISAAVVNRHALLIAAVIAGLVLLYDAWGKRHAITAAPNMGLCRAFNLLLGVAAVPPALSERWPIALIPFAYIVAVTAVSRGEVHGGSRRLVTFALVSLSAALLGLAFLVVRSGHAAIAALVLAVLASRVMPPFLAARRRPDAARIRTAVQRGVLSLVLVDAALGTAYAGPVYGAIIVATALVAGLLARLFPVT
jgi:4-hydroxybenzoate polyprenyltransferase